MESMSFPFRFTGRLVSEVTEWDGGGGGGRGRVNNRGLEREPGEVRS